MPIFASAPYTSVCRYITKGHQCRKSPVCITDIMEMPTLLSSNLLLASQSARSLKSAGCPQ